MSRTVTLPIVQGTHTIGDAYNRLERYGRSGVVVPDDRGPIVITTRVLDYFEKSSPGGDQTTISQIADSLFAAADAPSPTGWDAIRSVGRSLGLTSAAASRRSSKSALGQDDYSVLDMDTETATVIPRDARKSEELSQPFKRGSSPAALA